MEKIEDANDIRIQGDEMKGGEGNEGEKITDFGDFLLKW